MKRQSQTISGALFMISFLLWAIYSRSPRPLLALLAILLHEGGHWLAIKLCRVPLDGFGFNSCEARLCLGSPVSYKKEIIICAAGPAANLLSLLPSLHKGTSLFGESALSFFTSVSAALALLNLLPIGDLDGGRLLTCLLSMLVDSDFARQVCEILSFLTLFCLWSVSVYALLRTGGSLSLFFFSATLFYRVFISTPSRGIKRIQKNKRE